MLLFQSCKKEGCTDSAAINYDENADAENNTCVYPEIGLNVLAKFGTSDFQLNEIYTDPSSNKKIQFTTFNFYISNVQVGDSKFDNKVILFQPGTLKYFLGTINKGIYEDFKLSIGLDQTTNHADPTMAAAPLNESGMHWGWNPMAGYKFIKIEGLVDNDGDDIPEAHFEYHTAKDNMLRNLTFAKSIDVTNHLNLTLRFDLSQLFQNIDLTTDLSNHGDGPISETITDNFIGSIALQ